MVQQTVLPFKLKRAPEQITARSGLVIFAEFMKALKLDRLISKYMPKAGSEAGIYAINYTVPISLMLYGGGEAIEDIPDGVTILARYSSCLTFGKNGMC